MTRSLLLLGIALLACGGGGSLSSPPHAAGPTTAPSATTSGGAPAAEPTSTPRRALHRGVAWVGGRRPVTAADFPPLLAANVDWIAQTPFGWQRDERSPEVRLVTAGHVWWGETDEGLELTTRLARERGISTLLKPHLWLTRPGKDAWHGSIAMQSDADWERWFAGYRQFALHYARLAERLEIPVFCVGTELHGTVRARPDEWRRLIREVRQVYGGQLTYAANWHQELEDVSFWDDLDFIGVQAYFPLGDAELPSVEELTAAWQPHVVALEALARRHRRPVLFTEVGYVSRPGATAEPWRWPEHLDEEPPSAEGLELQARAYEAFFRAFWGRPWVAGAYFWKWYPGTAEPTVREVDFSPQGKPAEQVLRRWFGGESSVTR